MNNISIDIGHVVLDGVQSEAINGERLGRMTQEALQGLLEQRGVPSGLTGGDVRDIAAPTVNLPPRASEAQIAHELAQALYQAIVRRG
jgi:hypothetical protein